MEKGIWDLNLACSGRVRARQKASIPVSPSFDEIPSFTSLALCVLFFEHVFSRKNRLGFTEESSMLITKDSQTISISPHSRNIVAITLNHGNLITYNRPSTTLDLNSTSTRIPNFTFPPPERPPTSPIILLNCCNSFATCPHVKDSLLEQHERPEYAAPGIPSMDHMSSTRRHESSLRQRWRGRIRGIG